MLGNVIDLVRDGVVVEHAGELGGRENGGDVRLVFAPVAEIDVGRENHETAATGLFGGLGEGDGFGGAESGDAGDNGRAVADGLDGGFENLCLFVGEQSCPFA